MVALHASLLMDALNREGEAGRGMAKSMDAARPSWDAGGTLHVGANMNVAEATRVGLVSTTVASKERT